MSKYLKLLQPATLDNLTRIGGCGDGGYVMLPYPTPPPPPTKQNDKSQNNQPKAVSLGVSESSPWDLEIANMGYQVLQYDASIKQSPDSHPNIIFHKKFVGTRKDHQTITLENILQDYKFDPTLHNILQCDIEGAEWEIFDKLDFDILKQYFAQIIIEFHDCDPRSESRTQRQFAILEKFHQYYQPIHLHFNPCDNIFYIKDRFFASLPEVTYLRRDLLPNHFTLRQTCGDVEHLDYPNIDMFPNLPIDFANI